MGDPAPIDDALAAGRSALARGAWREARAAFDAALEREQRPAALEGLSWAAWWLEDPTGCMDAREQAYRLYRRAGDRRAAARMALWLGDDHVEFRGARAVAEGWFRRAARILDGCEPCPEHGWLAVFEAHAALGRHDATEARRLAEQAQESGRRHGAVDLEMFGLASAGTARFEQGDIAGGLRCLDEAAVAALAGEYESLAPAAWACCLVMSTCERVRDYERGAQWCQRIEEFSRRMDAGFVQGVCRAHHGAILAWHGDWARAERELLGALERLSAARPSWRPEALVRLGELRRRQGRTQEAAALFEQVPDHPLAQRGLAALLLSEGADPATARDLLERALRQVPPSSPAGRADALELLVDAEIALGAHAAAVTRLEELRAVAAAVPTDPLRAAVCVREGRVAAATGDHERAGDHFEDAIDLFVRVGAPLEAAAARLDLARTLHAADRPGAAHREATAALDALEALGAAATSARGLLGQLEGRHTGEAPLTARQLDVLRLVAEGLSDKQIAARLILSEHTVHRHIANIYTRLGCSSRAAAVAHASRLDLL